MKYISTNLLQWQQDSTLLSALDFSQVASLESYVALNNDYGGIEAINILNFFYGYNYFFDVPDTDYEEAGERKEEKIKSISSLYHFTASPNPAGDYSSISWIPFSTKTGNAILKIVDTKGVEVMQCEVNSKNGQYLLNTSYLSNGMYLVQLQTPERILQTKLHVQR